MDQHGEEKGDIDPLTPIAGTAGGIGRTPVPVAESTCQPRAGAFTPGETPGGGEGLAQRSAPEEPTQDQGVSTDRNSKYIRRGSA